MVHSMWYEWRTMIPKEYIMAIPPPKIGFKKRSKVNEWAAFLTVVFAVTAFAAVVLWAFYETYKMFLVSHV